MKTLKCRVAGSLVALAGLALVGGLLVVFSPGPVQADLFSAGNWDQSGSICSCPLEVGDCICRFKT